MDYLPKGANFTRAKMLWEIGLHIMANPLTPYGGNRDICITVGSGGGAEFKPWLRLATGSAIMAEDVAKGDIEVAFVNPSGLLTQAVRGVGIFKQKLPLCMLASFPSWDWAVLAIHQRTGLRSLSDLIKARYPLKLSIREDPTHSSLVLLDQLLAIHGVTLADLESWGGKFQHVGPPGDKKRLAAIEDGSIDAVFDEGVHSWLPPALENGFKTIEFEPATFAELEKLGWRRETIPQDRFPRLKVDHPCIDFSGWPLYCRQSMPEQDAYDFCAAIGARADFMPWDQRCFTGLSQVWTESKATPMDVPLHPGAARWYREQFGNRK